MLNWWGKSQPASWILKEAHSKLLSIETWNTTVVFLPNPRIISADAIKKHNPSWIETGNTEQTGNFT